MEYLPLYEDPLEMYILMMKIGGPTSQIVPLGYYHKLEKAARAMGMHRRAIIKYYNYFDCQVYYRYGEAMAHNRSMYAFMNTPGGSFEFYIWDVETNEAIPTWSRCSAEAQRGNKLDSSTSDLS